MWPKVAHLGFGIPSDRMLFASSIAQACIFSTVIQWYRSLTPGVKARVAAASLLNHTFNMLWQPSNTSSKSTSLLRSGWSNYLISLIILGASAFTFGQLVKYEMLGHSWTISGYFCDLQHRSTELQHERQHRQLVCCNRYISNWERVLQQSYLWFPPRVQKNINFQLWWCGAS